MRTFAIGDIHGCRLALDALLSIVPYGKEDTLITLGDYVDRGPDSKGVIERLIALRGEVNFVALGGNHEAMMLMARGYRASLLDWYDSGGDATIASYGGGRPGDLLGVPDEHWDFLEKTLPYHETPDHIYVHAGVDPHLDMADQPFSTLYWTRFWHATRHKSGRIVICGHTPQREGLPADNGHSICIDTYVFGGGWLTCLEPATRICWQANEKGETRELKLQ